MNFFFPLKNVAKTSTDEIYLWENNYILDEKVLFHEKIRKIMTSNYLENISDSIYDEVFVNGKNSCEQYFFVNRKPYNYSIYPIVFENINGKKEHILSIIYIYNNQLFIDKYKYSYSSSIIIKIILELLLFIIFGYGLLYVIYLTFNTFSKHIVIPVKNVIYMLKGINIGGKRRLNFLSFLEKRRDENLENLENEYFTTDIRIINYKLSKNKESGYNKINNDDNDYQDNDNFIKKDNTYLKEAIIHAKKNYFELYKKYDEESDFIEKEISFYDFNEQLLQYRPLEIENLMKPIMNIRKAFILTSKDRDITKK